MKLPLFAAVVKFAFRFPISWLNALLILCPVIGVSLSHFRIRHIRLSHDHLMAREVPPVCGYCTVRLSVFNALIECSAYYVPLNLFFLFLDVSASL